MAGRAAIACGCRRTCRHLLRRDADHGPKGHGTQFGLPIPTIESPSQAPAFVDARIAEGSAYIKIVYDAGDAYNISLPSIDETVLRAVVAAARARGKLAIVHVGSRRAAETAIAAGANGLVHTFGDELPPAQLVRL
ncbi:MAG: hypothetical protein H0W08_09170 [Acidobacteria bacterium]|nr:hypothetical protein [Acidobacteriota bacterium]